MQQGWQKKKPIRQRNLIAKTRYGGSKRIKAQGGGSAGPENDFVIPRGRLQTECTYWYWSRSSDGCYQ